MVTELTSSSGRGVGGVDAMVVQVVPLPPHAPRWVWRLAEVLGPCLPSALWHESSNYWIRGGKYTSFAEYRFAIKARLNLLPTRTVRKRGGEAILDTSCQRCHEEQWGVGSLRLG